METLPKLRILVEPYNGIFKKWEWSVQKSTPYKGHDIWLTASTGVGFGYQSGYARTQEKALEKGKKSAAKYCEFLLKVDARRIAKDKATIAVPVTCEGEPV